MAGELQAQHVTGATLYATLVDATGGVWNGSAFDATPTAAEWATYDIAMTEDSTIGYYRGAMPAAAAGRYTYRVHKQLGGSPATTDPVVWTGEGDWSGTAWDYQAGAAGATPATFWTYENRTLTQGAASVTAAVTGSSVTQYRGTRWSITLTGLTDMTGQTAVWFGVKANGREDADTASICLVKTATGLIAFDGDDTITAGHAEITVNSTTSITITVEADATQYATPGQYEYAVKALNASGKPFMVSSGGTFIVSADIPMAIS